MTAIGIAFVAYGTYFVFNRFRTLGQIVTDSAQNQANISRNQTAVIETQKVSDTELLTINANQTITTVIDSILRIYKIYKFVPMC